MGTTNIKTENTIKKTKRGDIIYNDDGRSKRFRLDDVDEKDDENDEESYWDQ